MTKGNPQLHPVSAEKLAARIAAELGKPARAEKWNPAGGSVLGGSVQLFGRLANILINRLNEAPEQHFRAFLNTAEIDRLPPRPACAEITFLPAPESPVAIKVPKGTQAATRPSGDQPEVIFETESDLVVTPTYLAACISVDETEISDRTRPARGEESDSFAAFAGEHHRERILYLGDDLFAFKDEESRTHGLVLITFTGIPDDSKWPLCWSRYDGQKWLKLRAVRRMVCRQPGPDGHSALAAHYILKLPDLPEFALRDRQTRWLAAQFTPDPVRKQLPSLAGIEIRQRVKIRQSKPRPADSAIAAIQGGKIHLPLDPLNPIQPLGPQPIIMDACYLRLDDALQKAGALVTLELALTGLPAAVENTTNLDRLQVAWEYYSVNGWQLLGTSRRGCPDLERLEFDLTSFPKPTLRSNRLTGKKYLEFRVPADYDDTSRPTAFAGAKLKTDIYTGERFFEIEVPDGCKNLPDDLLINGCYQPAAQHPEFKDKTCALTTSGIVRFRVPKPGVAGVPPFASTEVNGQGGFWLRARLIEGSYDEPRSVRQLLGQRVELPPIIHAPIIAQLQVSFAGYNHTTPAERVDYCLNKVDERWRDLHPALEKGEHIEPFTGRVEEPALYAGFLALDDDILRPAFAPNELLELNIDVIEANPAIDPAIDPAIRARTNAQRDSESVVYEFWNGADWRRLRTIDETRSLTRSGRLLFYAPADHVPSDEFGRPAWWLRVRAGCGVLRPAANLGALLLNTVLAVNAQTVQGEVLGSSNGKPYQTFTLTRSPVLPDLQIQVHEREAGSAAEAGALGFTNGAVNGAQSHDTWVTWQRVDSFFDCGPDSRCFLLDQAAGVITFGDGQTGKIPPPGIDNIRAARYRTHSGRGGNVAAGAITDLRSPQGGLGSIDRVTNRAPAAGGGDAEVIDLARRRGPYALKHRGRAVTQEDYQWLGLEIDGVARVYPLPTVNPNGDLQPGWVTLVVVPQATSGAAYDPRQELSPALKRVVRAYLEERMLTNLSSTAARVPGGKAVDGLHLRAADFMEVCVNAAIVVKETERGDAVKLDVIKQLEAFLHPLTGGPQRTGWVLGRDVHLSEVAAEIESVPGVDHVVGISLAAPNLQHWQLPVAEGAQLAQDFGVGSQVCLIDERIRLMLAQPLTRDESPDCLAIYGFKIGGTVKLVDTTGQMPKQSLTIAGLDTGKEAGRLYFARRIEPPPRAAAEQYVLQSPDGRMQLPLKAWCSTLGPDGRTPITGAVVQSFAKGDRIALVHSQVRRRIHYPLVIKQPTTETQQQLFVPESYLVCSGQHTLTLELEGA